MEEGKNHPQNLVRMLVALTIARMMVACKLACLMGEMPRPMSQRRDVGSDECRCYADHRGYCIGDGEMRCMICHEIYGPDPDDCDRLAGGHVASDNVSSSGRSVQCARCGFWFNPRNQHTYTYETTEE